MNTVRWMVPVALVGLYAACDELTVDEVTQINQVAVQMGCRAATTMPDAPGATFCDLTVGEVDTLEIKVLLDSSSVTGVRVSWFTDDPNAVSIRTLQQVLEADSTRSADSLSPQEKLGLQLRAEVVARQRGLHFVQFSIDSAGFFLDDQERQDFNAAVRDSLGWVIDIKERWQVVTAGRDHTCALTYHDAGTLYRAFATSLRPGGKAFCWGFNTDGALGTGDFDSDVPQQVASDDRFTSISAGANHTCAVDFRRLVSCWGRNERGQLGTGDELDQFTPRLLALGSPFSVASPGDEFTCGTPATAGFALSTTCWGSNADGQLGCDTGEPDDNPCLDQALDEKGDQLVPSEDVKTDSTLAGDPTDDDIYFSSVSAGARHACGPVIDLGSDFAGHMADGSAWCWGDNRYGQLGISSAPVCDGVGVPAFPCERIAVQAQGPGGGTPLSFQQIAAGGEFTCGAALDGQVYCWGRNHLGQLGNGNTVDSDAPVQVIGNFGAGVTALTAGETHACVLTFDSAAYCWGANADGQLGDSTTTGRLQAVAVVGGHVFASIAAGSNHTCGVVSTAGAGFAPADFDGGGPIFCWGSNGSIFSGEFGGKLGTGGRDGSNMVVSSVFPVRVAEPFDFFF